MGRQAVILCAALFSVGVFFSIPQQVQAQSTEIGWQLLELAPDLQFRGLAITADGQLVVSGDGTYLHTEEGWQRLDGSSAMFSYFGPNGLIISSGTDVQTYSRSLDMGATWEVLMMPPAAFKVPSPGPRDWADAFANMHGADSVILAELRERDIGFPRFREVPVLRSTDRGATWDTLDHYIDRVYPTSGRRLWAGSEGDIVYSDDLGDTWHTIPVDSSNGIETGLERIKHVLGSENGDVVLSYEATGACLLARWDPDASQWEPLATPGDCTLDYSRGPGGTLWAFGRSGLFLLTGSDTWAQLGTAPVSIEGFGEMPDGTLAVGTTNRGVYLSADDGVTWTVHLLDPGKSTSFHLHSDGRTFFSAQSSGLYRSSDGGETWQALPVDSSLTSIFTTSDGQVFAAVGQGGILWSGDLGDTWSVSHSSLIVSEFAETESGAQLAGHRCINDFAGERSVYRLEEGRWEPTGAAHLHCVRSFSVHPSFGVAIAAVPNALVSKDGGRKWQDMLGTGGPSLMTVDDDGRLYIHGSTTQVSENGGRTFREITSRPFISALSGTQNGVLFGDAYGHVFYWDAAKETTVDLGSVTRRDVSQIAQDAAGRIVVRGRFGDVYVSEVVSLGRELEVPVSTNHTNLDPPYPNPAVDAVHVPFSLEQAGNVRITVSNVLGRQLATLIDRVMPQGAHTVKWSAASFARGLYFVRMETTSRSVARAVMVR